VIDPELTPEEGLDGPDRVPPWHKEDLDFTEDGHLLIKNPALAAAIARKMEEGRKKRPEDRKRIWIDRPGSPRREATVDQGKGGSEGSVVAKDIQDTTHPVNMMCPCAPES